MNKTPQTNIFEWLEEVRKRPGMYIRKDLCDLENMIYGYYTALDIHGIIETGPKIGRDFTEWLHIKTGIEGALGWAHIIKELQPDPKLALISFYDYIDEYKDFKLNNGEH